MQPVRWQPTALLDRASRGSFLCLERTVSTYIGLLLHVLPAVPSMVTHVLHPAYCIRAYTYCMLHSVPRTLYFKLSQANANSFYVVYDRLGNQWATSLLAFLTLAMLPFP